MLICWYFCITGGQEKRGTWQHPGGKVKHTQCSSAWKGILTHDVMNFKSTNAFKRQLHAQKKVHEAWWSCCNSWFTKPWLTGCQELKLLHSCMISPKHMLFNREKKKIEKTDLWSDPERYIDLFSKFCTSALPAGNKNPAVALPTSNSLQWRFLLEDVPRTWQHSSLAQVHFLFP